MATPERDAEATQWTRPSSSLSSQERGSSPLVAVGVTRPFPPPESVSPRLNAAVAREACVYLDKWRYASARVSPMQRRAVEEDPRLARLFLALDLLGPKGAPRGALAAQLALVSTTTLWRLFRAVLGCTYFKFVRRWRVAAAALIYRCGKGHLRQDVAAERTGFWTRSRLRAAFLACTGLLPTGSAPRSLASASRRGSPLFAGTG